MADAVILRAHFDGEHIVLDEPFEMEPGTELKIAILSDADSDREAWLQLSLKGLGRAYSDDEPEYTLDMIRERNPDYEGG